jgi:hypothetical protein
MSHQKTSTTTSESAFAGGRGGATAPPAITSNMPAFVDAQWGLERMIGALAEVSDLGPFLE